MNQTRCPFSSLLTFFFLRLNFSRLHGVTLLIIQPFWGGGIDGERVGRNLCGWPSHFPWKRFSDMDWNSNASGSSMGGMGFMFRGGCFCYEWWMASRYWERTYNIGLNDGVLEFFVEAQASNTGERSQGYRPKELIIWKMSHELRRPKNAGHERVDGPFEPSFGWHCLSWPIWPRMMWTDCILFKLVKLQFVHLGWEISNLQLSEIRYISLVAEVGIGNDEWCMEVIVIYLLSVCILYIYLLISYLFYNWIICFWYAYLIQRNSGAPD